SRGFHRSYFIYCFGGKCLHARLSLLMLQDSTSSPIPVNSRQRGALQTSLVKAKGFSNNKDGRHGQQLHRSTGYGKWPPLDWAVSGTFAKPGRSPGGFSRVI